MVEEIAIENRGELARIINQRSPQDAFAAYFALEHPADRVRIFVSRSNASKVVGFLIKAQTGYDLFRPLLIPFTVSSQDLNSLLEAAVIDTQQALISLPKDQIEQVSKHFRIEAKSVSELLRLDPKSYKQIINVLVMGEDTAMGWPRFEVRSGELVVAATGVNWSGERFSEIYIEQLPDLTQDYASSLLSAIAGRLLKERKIALLRLAENERRFSAAAQEVGFKPTGARMVVGTISK
jgi:hypothetical protein